MSFFRHEEIFRSDMFDWSGGGISAAPGLIGCDEFPAGYSSVGCAPAEPTSASPAAASMLLSILDAKNFAANGKLSPITVSQPWGSLQSVPP